MNLITRKVFLFLTLAAFLILIGLYAAWLNRAPTIIEFTSHNDSNRHIDNNNNSNSTTIATVTMPKTTDATMTTVPPAPTIYLAMNTRGSPVGNRINVPKPTQHSFLSRNDAMDNQDPKEVKFLLCTMPIGGLGDRLRTLLLGYYMSLLTNRIFLFSKSYFAGDKYIHVKEKYVQWNGKSAEELRSTSSPFLYSEVDRHVKPWDNFDFNTVKDRNVWIFNSNIFYPEELFQNKQLAEHPNFAWFKELHDSYMLNHHALNELLVPSASLARLVDEVMLKELPENFYRIGLHIRYGDTDDLRRPSTSSWNRSRRGFNRFVRDVALPCFPYEAIQHWKTVSTDPSHPPYAGVVFFITADYKPFALKAMEALRSAGYKHVFNTDAYSGEIKHLHYAGKEQQRTFLDWFLLTKMDHLIISLSGYSEHAAKYGCLSSQVFVDGPELIEAANYVDNLENCSPHFIYFTNGTAICNEVADRSPLSKRLHIFYPQAAP